MAFVGYAETVINLVPLLELDGYYILVDLVDMPRLRERSFAFLRHQLPGKLAHRERFSGQERIFALYGLLAALATVLAVVLALIFWQTQLVLLMADLLGREGVWAKLGLLALVLAIGGPAVAVAVHRWRPSTSIPSQ